MTKFRNYDNYEIYADGRIYSYYTNKFLKPQTLPSGYQQVGLVDNEGNFKTYRLHRVIYEAITGEPIPEGYEINHISEAKDENFFENLQLVTHKDNCNYGSRNSRIRKANTNNQKLSKANTNNPKRSKQVGAYKDGELVMTFPSTEEAGRQGFSQCNIVSCCNGERKTHKGFQWRYI